MQNLNNDSPSFWFETDRATLTLFCILLETSFQFPYNLLFRSLNFSTKYEDPDDGICFLHSYISLLGLEVLLSRLSCAVHCSCCCPGRHNHSLWRFFPDGGGSEKNCENDQWTTGRRLSSLAKQRRLNFITNSKNRE